MALKNLAGNALGRLVGRDLGDGKATLGIELGVRFTQRQTAGRNLADPPPLPWRNFEDLVDPLHRRAVPLGADDAGVPVFHLRATLLQLPDTHQYALENIDRLEARDYDRHTIPLGDRAVLVHAGDGANVSGGQEALDAVQRRVEHRAHGRRDQHVGDEYREVRQTKLRRLDDRHSVGRGGCLEADGEENDLPVGMLLGQGHGVHRRIDQPHVAPFRLDGEQVLPRAGYAEHVAERAENHLRPAGDDHRAVDALDGSDADRAARAVDQRDLRRQHLIQPVADDRVRLPAANLHDVPRPGGRRANGGGQASNGFGVAVFVEVFQGGSGVGGSFDVAASISRKKFMVSCASASSMMLMAKPTWTRT